MQERITEVTKDLLQVVDDARAQFGDLSSYQLNWKPAEKSWSVAQCFDHLITTHSLYFPLLERLAGGPVKLSLWEKYSPLSGFFGRFLIKSLDPANQKKMKTTARGVPSSSEIDAKIIDRFCEHQKELIARLEKLPRELDADKTIITSPMMGIVTYNVADMLTILRVHCRRHFNQATRVTETAGFPGH